MQSRLALRAFRQAARFADRVEESRSSTRKQQLNQLLHGSSWGAGKFQHQLTALENHPTLVAKAFHEAKRAVEARGRRKVARGQIGRGEVRHMSLLPRISGACSLEMGQAAPHQFVIAGARHCSLPHPSLPCFALPCLALPCLALPCLALPCFALPCLALPCLALPCLALPCLALPCFALPCLALPCLALPCLALPCLALPCLALPCLALPCLALPCLALPCLALPCLALPCLALPCFAQELPRKCSATTTGSVGSLLAARLSRTRKLKGPRRRSGSAFKRNEVGKSRDGGVRRGA